MAFPVSLLGIWLIDYAFEYNIAASKWTKLLTDISPVHSPAIFHAAIAGVFLFLSGIISGSIANRDKHHQVYYRIQEHPVLKMTFGREKTKKLPISMKRNGQVLSPIFGLGCSWVRPLPSDCFLG